MFDVIKMMHSLSNRSFEDLLTIAISEGAQSCSKPSKIEVITAIIANRSYRAARFTPPKEATTNRTPYRITEADGSEHYLQLTDEQERFLNWNVEHCIDYDRDEVEILDDIEWETP